MALEALPHVRAGDCEQCSYPRVLVGDDAEPPFEKGMVVLLPCEVCGTPSEEYVAMLEYALDGQRAAFERVLHDKFWALYHWAPAHRRGQIIRFGLRPRMRVSTHSLAEYGDVRFSQICLADTPQWAWDLSAGQSSAPSGEWDLWQVRLANLRNVEVLPGYNRNGIHEVRVDHRIYKRDVHYVASRSKP